VTRHVAVRIVALREGETTPVEDNERVARVDWTGKRVYLLILQDPVPSRSKDISTFTPGPRHVSLSDDSEQTTQWAPEGVPGARANAAGHVDGTNGTVRRLPLPGRR
jgi:hypothetical protein